MRWIVWIVLWVAGSAVGAAQPPAGSGETAALHQWLNIRYERELQRSPMTLTSLGRRELYDQIDDFSEAGVDAELAELLESARQMEETFDYRKLSAQGKVSYDFWLYRAEQGEAERKFLRNYYVFDQFSGAHTRFAAFLINYHEVDSKADMQAYIARIKGSARALGELLERAQRGAEQGVRPPRFAYRYVIQECRNLISGAPFSDGEDSPLWADAREKLAGLRAAGLVDSKEAAAMEGAVKAALLEHWQPAYQAVIGWLESDLPNTDARARGAYALPNGEAYYNHRVALNTQTDYSAGEIHQLGLREVARIRQEMDAIRQAVGFKGDMDEFLDFVRQDSSFYYPNTDAGRQAYLDETRRYLESMEARLPRYFGLLPRASLVVKRVEAFKEQDGAAPYYQEGTADGSRPGVYYLHLSDMSAMNITDLETTAYHEGYPGHHLQGAIAMERKELPLFRNIEWYSAYGEGWALYAERLAKEMGAFEKPYYDFGRLANELWRAVRLVLDTGIHARGWSEEKAVAYMLANTATPEASVHSEVQRYFVAPGQALSYKMGMIKILQLREKARRALGDKFDIRGFHDVVLDGGAVPLPLLERAVDEWIVTQGG